MKALALVVLAACNFGFPDATPPHLVDRAPVKPGPVQPRIKLGINAEYYYHQLAEHDARLDAAATDFARFVDAGGLVDRAVAERALRMQGIVEPVQQVAAAATAAELDKILWDDANHSNARWAYAKTKTGMVGILVYAAPVNLDYLPRAGTEFHIAGTFESNVSAPTMMLDFQQKLPVAVEDHAFKTDLVCKGKNPGEHVISIEVTDPKRWFKPMVYFPVYCGIDAPTTLVGEPAVNVDVPKEQFASRLVEIIDRERAAAQLPAMHWNRRLAQATDTMLIDHSKRIFSIPEWHLKRANVLNPFAEFTEFHTDSLGSAVTRIVDDEHQKQKYLDGHNADISVSVRPDDKGYWVVVGYLGVPRIQDVPTVQPILSARIRAAKLKQFANVPYGDSVYEVPWLSVLATGYAQELAMGWSFDSIHKRDAIFFHRAHVGMMADTAIDLDNYDLESTVTKARFWKWGVGIAQAPQDSPYAGMIFIVVLSGY
ncbi:MAG: hypothetical protein QM831_13450 [Kofleriaceae bacterium]